jgi:hypothetical protein
MLSDKVKAAIDSLKAKRIGEINPVTNERVIVKSPTTLELGQAIIRGTTIASIKAEVKKVIE